MQRRCFVLGFVIAMSLSLPALADLDKQQKRALSRIESLEKLLVKDLAKYTPEQIKSNLNARRNYKTLYKSIERKTLEIDQKIKLLPADNTELGPLIAEYLKLKAQSEVLLKLAEATDQSIEDTKQATATYYQSDDGEEDRNVLERAEQTFSDYVTFDLSVSQHQMHHLDRDIALATSFAQDWIKAEEDLQALILKRDKLGVKHDTAKTSREDRQRGQALIDKLRQQGASILPPLVNSAETALADAVKTKRFRNLSDTTSEASRLVRRVQVAGEILKVIQPSTQAAVEAQVQKIKSSQAKARQSLAAEIIAANRFPKDQYQGADAPQLKAFLSSKWKAKYPKDAIIRMQLNTPWERTTRWQYESSSKSWVLHDYSLLYGWVLIKQDGTQAAAHYVRLIKRHRQNNQLDYAFERSDKPGPEQIYLLKTL